MSKQKTEMPKIQTCHNYKFNPELHCERNRGLENQTVQGQAPPLRETMERFAKGLMINGEHEVYWQGEDGQVDFDHIPEIQRMGMDLTDWQRVKENAESKIKELIARDKQRRAEIQAKSKPSLETLKAKSKTDTTDGGTTDGENVENKP